MSSGAIGCHRVPSGFIRCQSRFSFLPTIFRVRLDPKNYIKTVPISLFTLIGGVVGYFISASIQPRSDTNEAFQLMAISLLA